MIRIANVVGVRPNLVKVSALLSAQRARPGCFIPQLIHTGQHTDATLSDDFFEDLQLPAPDVQLSVACGDRRGQIARMVRALEQCFADHRPDLVLVVGDVNSTLSAAIAARNAAIPIAHVEAGLRNGDLRMPEEVNRIVTDSLSCVRFASEPSAVDHLCREGYPAASIHLVGNVMVDTMVRFESLAAARGTVSAHGLTERDYAVLTLHRPATVDHEEIARPLFQAIAAITERLPIVFPMHPRTRNTFEAFGLLEAFASVPRLLVTPPLRYLDMLALVRTARLVLTDSGGLQDETSYLGVPCLTLRDNTERPYTVTHGTNRVIGTQPERLIADVDRLLRTDAQPRRSIPLWDGHAAERITAVLADAHLRELAAGASDRAGRHRQSIAFGDLMWS